MLSYLQSLFDFLIPQIWLWIMSCCGGPSYWLHVVSDSFIAIAYFSIPIVLRANRCRTAGRRIRVGVLGLFHFYRGLRNHAHCAGSGRSGFPTTPPERGSCLADRGGRFSDDGDRTMAIIAENPGIAIAPEQLRRANEALTEPSRAAGLRAAEALGQRKIRGRLKAEEMLRSLEQHRQIERSGRGHSRCRHCHRHRRHRSVRQRSGGQAVRQRQGQHRRQRLRLSHRDRGRRRQIRQPNRHAAHRRFARRRLRVGRQTGASGRRSR